MMFVSDLCGSVSLGLVLVLGAGVYVNGLLLCLTQGSKLEGGQLITFDFTAGEFSSKKEQLRLEILPYGSMFRQN